ncbi:MAG: Cof-type HAD-IIB family hydrolase [Tetragenococcus koreensis]|uniref:HAD family hydrolase n=1 Tax=Tetragenococcus koreensis TaxID=290335 RepID=UPI001F2957BD|nr:HAD family hydrolase [Tetragenococcus koreensis]MCF1631770.1 Cof-type HAD-IIB family hydrolase [Tetragenococcus koreensis]MDN6255759.1 Cof-type HAD-IIB family hydrolase [Tetragenococcus koreensis]MDN6345679.1 Cof-type HAD-IIB family hydrolase [Tetragenococcus koreensis]MDN6423839.1 Cof-type HAD-IIB family hydrolase [Tetragenococcus koreensis]MDN6846048.1 Cof-type HAD-IIB family hydrolase [Tetragenococcus koreensis]
MKKYKGVLFFDLDGTLLNRDSQISLENLWLLEHLAKQNYLSVIASGRSPKEIEEITEQTAISSYVSLNGQYVVIEGEVFADHRIAPELVDEVMTFSQQLGHPVACYTPTEYRVNFIDEATKKLYQLDNAPLPQVDPDFQTTVGVNMLYLFSEKISDDKLLEEKFNEVLTFYRDSPFSIAIVNKNRSKKAGIQELLTHLELTDLMNTYAFGDGNNDISMFEVVKYSVAMGNAGSNVKKAATFVTHDNETNGIHHALQHYDLL